MQKIKNNRTFGMNLRQLRKSNGLKQDDLIAQLNVLEIHIDRSRYSRFETGELNIPIELLVALRIIYKCTYDDFFRDIVLPSNES